MSLQVWLPLNGNLNNQGLSEVTVTNSGATIDSNGKVGSCYSFDGNDDFISLTSSSLYSIIKGGSLPFSVTMWVYRADTTRAILFGDYNLNGSINFNLELSTSNTVRFYWGANPDLTFNNAVVTTSKWSHLTLTYDGSSIKCYINGVLAQSSAITLTSKDKTSGSYYLGRDSRTGTTAFNGKMNDFRVYDHCLSAKEVKEISKGLICHYKLDNKGFGNPNLLITQNPSEFSRQGNKYTNNVVNSRTNDPFQLQYFKGSTYNSTFYSKDVSSTPCDIKTTFTVPESMTGIRVKFNGTSKDIELFSSGKAPVTSGETYTLSLRILSSKSETLGGVQVENPKLEKGSVATPWCPHTSDSLYTSLGLNSLVESDCSGYSYNGILSESLPYASGSPRYDGCYYFNSTSKRITLPAINMSGFSNSFSIAWWGKAPSYSSLMYWGFSNGNRLNFYSGMYCNTGDGSSNPYYKPNTTTTISTPSVDTWHHFVMVGDGSSNKLYMDGELYGVAKTYKGITGNTIVINGWDSSTSYKTNGYISDFRIYSTALSASDIKELYNTSASVDKNGNMYAYEFKEE